MIDTERLRIYPASREQMEAAIASEQDAELKKAYAEMLDGCIRNPDQWAWYAMWMIEQKDGTHIGDLCFKGLQMTASWRSDMGSWMNTKGRAMQPRLFRQHAAGLSSTPR